MLRYLLPLLLAANVCAQETLFHSTVDPATDTNIDVLALFSKPAPGGFMPVRVKIANNLKTAQTARLSFTSTTGYVVDLSSEASFEITAEPGKTVTRDLLVPLCPPRESSNDFNFSFRLSGSLGENQHSISSSFNDAQAIVLLSESLFTPHASMLDSVLSSSPSSPSSSYGRSGTQFSAKFDPKQLPSDWLAFSGYDSVVMTETDWSNVPAGSRNAILSWVRLGGQLLVYAEGTPNLAELGLPADSGLGRIRTVRYSAAGTFDASALVELTQKSPTPVWHSSVSRDYAGVWPLQIVFGSQTFRYALFVVVLVVFGILVGPVNLFVFAKSDRRHRLFVTTPLISLGASLVLIVMIIVQDGFGGSGIRRVLMEVRPDEGVNAAFVHQEQFSRTGVLTGASFPVPAQTSITPVPIPPSRWSRYTAGYGSVGKFNLQPDDGKLRASGDWFQSRSEQGQVLSATIPTRGRIEKTGSADTLLSTFDYPIQTLLYFDESDQWHRAQDIQAGKKFTLLPISADTAQKLLKTEISGFSQRNSKLLTDASKRPGHFVAVTNAAPGIVTLSSVRWKQTHTVITGPLK